ncbi:MAG: RNA-binding S4 domain-containing protein [Barnesiella sp.]|nr:RNA-binding S4 domain-containing protein [Barnesiella sp.]
MAKSEERIDKWLWAMRIFKTRTVATDSCKKGRVSVGPTADSSVVVKPSRLIKVDDIVHVRKPPVTYSFRVKALTENRLGARLVPDYMENITPQAQYDLLDVVKISGFIDRRKGLGRPTKREGRDLARFAETVNDGWDFDDSMLDDDDSDNRYNFDLDEEDFS